MAAREYFAMGRGVSHDSKISLISDDSDSFYSTRPVNIVSKFGSSGSEVKLVSNYFEVEQLPDFKFTQYRVDFEPNLDIAKIRNAFIAKQKDLFGGGYIYDGDSSLFLTKELNDEITRIKCESLEGKFYEIIIKKTKNMIPIASTKGMMLINLILRRAMKGLELQLIRRNYYDPEATIKLRDYKIELWPGYVTSIRQHEEKVLLCCEISHKVLREETAYDILQKCTEESDYKDSFIQAIVGSVVITRYNNKTYRIDDVDFTRSAASTFKFNDREKSFVEYYKERYNIIIHYPNQPLLISTPKARDIRAGRSEILCLIPELCYATGLTDSMRNNFQLMRGMSDYTRMDPLKRVERLMAFNNRMLTTPKAADSFKQFQTKLRPKLVEISARLLNQEVILFGRNKSIQNDFRVDWTNPMKVNAMICNVPLNRWGIIYPARANNDTRTFLKLLFEVASGMGYEMKEPKMMEIADDRVGTYARELENFVARDPKFVMVILPNASADRYCAVKKITCVNNSIPTQVVVQKTMQPKKGNIGSVKSIATKVLIQMNVKLGGAPWAVNIPIKSLMTVGFDVTHDTSDKRKSYGSFIASMDLKECNKYYSGVSSHKNGEECSGNIAIHMKKALGEFFINHLYLPQRILFYRDGVGEGDIPRVHVQEIQAIREAIREVYRSQGMSSEPAFAFVIVTKRINTRFFVPKGSKYENPNSGTVVDSVVTLPERYDFYLVSQSVRQGTVSPTNYNVICDDLGLTPDKMQLLTYKMCHLYYNWSGTTRVPSVLQYAQKLGVHVGQYLHQPPNELLCNQLYFL